MYVAVNGARLYFDVDGEGLAPAGASMREKPTVVLAHGGPGADHTIAKPYFSQLTDIAQVVYYDHRGNGRSELSTESHWNLNQWGDDLKGLCDALGIESPIVIGTSFGGFVALSYATRHAGHAAGLGLISTAARVDFETIYAAFDRLGGARMREIAHDYWENPSAERRAQYIEHCLPLYSRNPARTKEWAARVLWRNETALWFNGPRNEHGRMDYRASLANITCPTLVLAGEDDPIMPPAFSDAIVDGLVNADVTYGKFPDCGHGVVGDKPAEALEALRTFITSVSA